MLQPRANKMIKHPVNLLHYPKNITNEDIKFTELLWS